MLFPFSVLPNDEEVLGSSENQSVRKEVYCETCQSNPRLSACARNHGANYSEMTSRLSRRDGSLMRDFAA